MSRLNNDNPSRAVLLCACLLGLFRFYRIGDWSLWYDEAVTVADAWHASGQYNPLGYGLVRLSAALLGGPDAAALRMPAALLGWACIPLTWWAFRRAAGDLRASVAALFLALSPWALYWSQNARFYSMAQAFGIAGVGLMLRGLTDRSHRTAIGGLAVVSLGCGFHPTSALLAFALFLACTAVRPGSLREVRPARLIGVAVALGLLASPWAAGAFLKFVASKDTAGISSLARLVMSTGYFVGPTMLVGAAFGGVIAWRESDLGRVISLVPLLVCIAAGVAALLAASSAQYVFIMLPLVCVLAAWPISSLQGSHAIAWTGVLAAPLLAGSALYFATRHGDRPRWEEAYRHAWEQRAEGDLLMGMQAAVGEYYLNPGATDLRHHQAVVGIDRTNPHVWKALADSKRPIWLVVRPAFLSLWSPEDRAAFRAFLTGECRLSARFEVPAEGRDLDLEVWSRPRVARGR